MKKIFYTTIVLMIVSCANEEEIFKPQLPELKNDNIAIELVKTFAESHKGNQIETRSSEQSELIITDIESKTLNFDISEEVGNKNLKSNLKTVSVKLKTVKFKQKDKKGFSVVSDDNRINKVYAYSENGSLSDTTFNIGLKIALEKIEKVCELDLIEHYKNEGTMKTRAASPTYRLFVNNIIPTRWNQTAPYNLNAIPASSCSRYEEWKYAGRAAAGCAPVAIAQAVAYLCPPALSTTYNLPLLRQTTFNEGITSGTGVSDVAAFVRYIGSCLNASYGCSTSSMTKDIRDDFTRWGISYHFDTNENVNLGRTAKYLTHGLPTITRGSRKHPVEGHAWLWTGIDCQYTGIKSDGDYLVVANTVLLWCNWGWGGSSDGWFIEFEKPDPSKEPYMDNNNQLYILGTSFVRP